MFWRASFLRKTCMWRIRLVNERQIIMAVLKVHLFLCFLSIFRFISGSVGEVINQHQLIEITAELSAEECDELIDALKAHSFDWTKHHVDQSLDQDPSSCLERLENWTKGDTGSWSYLFLGLQEIERPELAQKFAQEVSSDVITRLRSIPTSRKGARKRKKRRTNNEDQLQSGLQAGLQAGLQDGIQENAQMMKTRGSPERGNRPNSGRTNFKRMRLEKQDTGKDMQENEETPRQEVKTGEGDGVATRRKKGRRKNGAERRREKGKGKTRGRGNRRKYKRRGCGQKGGRCRKQKNKEIGIEGTGKRQRRRRPSQGSGPVGGAGGGRGGGRRRQGSGLESPLE